MKVKCSVRQREGKLYRLTSWFGLTLPSQRLRLIGCYAESQGADSNLLSHLFFSISPHYHTK